MKACGCMSKSFALSQWQRLLNFIIVCVNSQMLQQHAFPGVNRNRAPSAALKTTSAHLNATGPYPCFCSAAAASLCPSHGFAREEYPCVCPWRLDLHACQKTPIPGSFPVQYSRPSVPCSCSCSCFYLLPCHLQHHARGCGYEAGL
jgi:hypothetical protein